MKKLFINTLIVLIFFVHDAAYAENNEKPEKSQFDFFGSLATKVVYSTGISDPYTYNRTDVTGGFKSEYIDFSAYIRRYFNFQVTDGSGVYEYRSFNEAGMSLKAHLFSIVNLSGEYSRADDFNDLKRDTYYGAIEMDFSRVTLSADYSRENFEYKMNSNVIRTEKQNYSFTMDFNFTDSFSADAGYKHDNTYFNSLGYNYYKDIFRAGLTIVPADYLFLITGASGGKDSEDYTIYGADCGATLRLYSSFKVYLIYSFSYYDAPQTETSGGGGGGHGHGAGSTNPYLSSDRIGKSYYSHAITVGMSVTF